MTNIHELHSQIDKLLEEQSNSESTLAWEFNKRCVHALAYRLQEPGERWQAAHQFAWLEWATAWDPEREAYDFVVTLVNHFRLTLDEHIDQLMQLSAVYWLAYAQVVFEAAETADEPDECNEKIDSQHLEVVVDNGPILSGPNPNPPTLVVQEPPDRGQ